RINSFGFLQGQELMDSSQPTNSVYFPHLIFQEWLAAYYLVNCLYESNETKEHEQVCSILVNQQLTPKYSAMIPFMAGILYGNIENKKVHHDQVYYIFGNCCIHRHFKLFQFIKPLDNVMKLYLPNFQYLFIILIFIYVSSIKLRFFFKKSKLLATFSAFQRNYINIQLCYIVKNIKILFYYYFLKDINISLDLHCSTNLLSISIVSIDISNSFFYILHCYCKKAYRKSTLQKCLFFKNVDDNFPINNNFNK
ncbi:hypothetical protein RFI_34408, partial [Reticulomyxa filosa]